MTQSDMWQPSDIISTETAPDVDAPRRRGRIPQSAWPQILERHRAGDTLSAIARQFDCTPSAISYIVRKAEAAGIEPPAPHQPEPSTGDRAATAPLPVPAALVARPGIAAESAPTLRLHSNVTSFDAKASRTMETMAARTAATPSSTRLTLTPVSSAPATPPEAVAALSVAPPAAAV